MLSMSVGKPIVQGVAVVVDDDGTFDNIIVPLRMIYNQNIFPSWKSIRLLRELVE